MNFKPDKGCEKREHIVFFILDKYELHVKANSVIGTPIEFGI